MLGLSSSSGYRQACIISLTVTASPPSKLHVATAILSDHSRPSVHMDIGKGLRVP